jgi:hypothetical protein
VRLWLALCVAGGLALLLQAQGVLAHGGGAPVVTREPLGDLLLYVWADPATPTAGQTLHVTVGVTQLDAAGAETPITDAAILLRALADGQPPQEVEAASGASAGGVYYEADLTLDAGQYTIEVVVSPAGGAAAAGSVAFSLAVEPAAGIRWWLVWLGGASIAVGLVLYLVAVMRGRRTVVAVPQ